MVTQKSTAGLTLGELLPGIDLASDAMITPPGVASESLEQLRVEGLQLDSRKIQPGDVFIAVPGFDQNNVVDGRQFIEQAMTAGAVAVLAEREGWTETLSFGCPVPVLWISGLSQQINAIAGRFYGQPSAHMQVIGITGTNGKTTCSHLLGQLFNRLKIKTAVIGTLGYGVADGQRRDEVSEAGLIDPDLIDMGLTSTGLTTPDAVTNQAVLADMRADNIACVAMEISSHSLDQGRVSGLHLAGAVFTNLSQDHLDYHGTMAAYLAAKEKLFQMPGLEFAVINIDDPAGKDLVRALDGRVRCYGYSLSQGSHTSQTSRKNQTSQAPVEWAESVLYAKNIRCSARGIEADVVTPWGRARINSSLVGEFNLSNILAVMATACASGLGFNQVVSVISDLHPVSGRLEVISRTGPVVVIDYAHTPDALEQTLKALRFAEADSTERSTNNITEAAVATGKLWCVFGCGGDRDKAKRPMMAAIAEQLADEVVVTNDNPRSEAPEQIIDDILSGASRVFYPIEDRAQAIDFAISHARSGDTVLIAGKGHEDYQISGDMRLPFSDAAQARLALRRRASIDGGGGGGGDE